MIVMVEQKSEEAEQIAGGSVGPLIGEGIERFDRKEEKEVRPREPIFSAAEMAGEPPVPFRESGPGAMVRIAREGGGAEE